MSATTPRLDGCPQAWLDPSDPRHGNNSGYIAGCRTTCCRTAHATYKRNRRARLYLARTDALMVDSLGTQRRIRALMAMGWRGTDIDAELNRGERYTWNLIDQARVNIATAAAVSAVYERLCMKVGPSTRTRAMAAKKGWFPPLAWDDIDDPREQPTRRWSPRGQAVDEAVILRVLAGDPVPANRSEKVLITERWAESGRSLNELERLTGWNSTRYAGEAS